MTGPYYSSGPIKNVLLRANNTTGLLTDLRDTLLLCHWTLISATVGVGGTPVYKMRSKPTPINGNVVIVKLYYNGNHQLSDELSIVEIYNEAQTVGGFVGFLQTSSSLGDKTLRCIAGPHQFFVFIDLTISPNGNYNRGFDFNNLQCGCPHVTNPVKSDVFWGCGGLNTNFRSTLYSDVILGASACFLINGWVPGLSFPDVNANTKNCYPVLLSQRSIDLHNPVPMFDGTYPVTEPILVMGRVPHNYYAVNLWDAIVVGTRFSSKVLSTADGRTWESLTLSTSAEVPGCLFLATSGLINPAIGGFSY